MLNADQSAALISIHDWIKPSCTEPFFVLSGSAGTGKTYLLMPLVDELRGRVVFTAPTNKATKVLRQRLTTPQYKPDCRTIYSLLGLRLEPSGEIRELKEPDDPVDLSAMRLIVVDEGSMVAPLLMTFIAGATKQYPGLKFLFLGDRSQLPPVKEAESPVWALPGPKVELTTIVRFGGPILAETGRLRACTELAIPKWRAESNNADGEGVWAGAKVDFAQRLVEMTNGCQDFLKPEHTKVIAWRNATVDNWNKIIRAHLFDNYEQLWLPEDRLIFTAPAKDLNDETVATTDDEGTVRSVMTEYHPVYGDVKIWRLSVTMDDGTPVVARLLHHEGAFTFAQEVEKRAAEAKAVPRKWRQYWEYREAFHSARYAYAITAHRSQGSTYDTAFVDWRDVLVNPNTKEAYRCLYVAASRPRRRLILG